VNAWTLAALAALANGPAPDYPVDAARFPFLTETGRQSRITDFGISVQGEDRTSPAATARLRTGHWGFVAAQLGHLRSGLELSTHRGNAFVTEQRGRLDLGASYRLSRVRLDTHVFRRRDDQGSGWVLDASAGLRVTPDLELIGGLVDESDRATLGIDDRRLDTEYLRVLYQSGTRFEAAVEVAQFEQRTVGGINVEGSELKASGVGVALGTEWRGGFRYEWLEGRLGRVFGEAELDVTAPIPLVRRLVVTGGTGQRWEPGLGRFEERVEAGVAFHARRYRLARDGEVASRVLRLARRANELGYNERRVFDDAGLRAFRERLALSPARGELLPEVDALYRAQIAERNVPLLGIGFQKVENEIEGRLSRTVRVSFGIPWPPAALFEPRESAVRFITVSFAHTNHSFDSGFESRQREAAVDVELNRDMSLVVRWAEPSRTPLHAALRRGPSPEFEVALVYAQGR